MTMKSNLNLLRNACQGALALAIALGSSAGFAEKPDWAGGAHGDKRHQQDRHNNQGGEHGPGDKSGKGLHTDVRVGGYFGDQHRLVVRNYYGEQFKGGHCPPGLAKKNNGCMPPGQAKKYRVGQRLPSDVVYYPVPQAVYVQLGAPPSGYKYVRVASDILLIALGTSMVVDAIQDLGGL